MGILDGIVEWIAEQVMHGLDLINTSVLGALGCDMSVFLRYFPAAETMYDIFVALAIGLILLIWVWNLFKNFGIGGGSEAEDPVKLNIRSILFIVLAYYSDQMVDMALDIGGTPYDMENTSNLITSSSYSFRLNAIPMQAGEYVTDIYLDFGKVPVGFQSTSNPTLTVQVLGTIANSYQIINRADVGGKYQVAWQTGQATWVTIVRKLTPNPSLPKTGY